jgi:hypothetical protein
LFKLLERGVDVKSVPQDDDVYDQSERSELIFLSFMIALAEFAPLSVEDSSGQFMTVFAFVELLSLMRRATISLCPRLLNYAPFSHVLRERVANFHYINRRFDMQHQRVYAITQFKPDASAKFVHLLHVSEFWRVGNAEHGEGNGGFTRTTHFSILLRCACHQAKPNKPPLPRC